MVDHAATLSRGRTLLLAGLVLLPLGCSSTGGLGRSSSAKPKPVAGKHVDQVLATWQKQVQYGLNPTSQEPVAALVGRLHLFDKTGGLPIITEGTATVELYDPSQRGPDGKIKMLEQWNFDAEMFQQLIRRDVLGECYTLMLPWSTYQPEIKQVQLVVRFEPKGGTPMSSSQVMTIDHGQPPAALVKKDGPKPSPIVQAAAK